MNLFLSAHGPSYDFSYSKISIDWNCRMRSPWSLRLFYFIPFNKKNFDVQLN